MTNIVNKPTEQEDVTLNIHMFKAAVPLKARDKIQENHVEDFNKSIPPDELRLIRDNVISYSSILKNPHYTVKDYLDAVKYVSYVMTGDSHIEAYKKTFPLRVQDFVEKQYTNKRVSQHVSMYHKGQLVTDLLDYATVPIYILNSDKLQLAINTLAELSSDVSAPPMVRAVASGKLLEHLKKPESIKQKDIDLAVSNNSTITILENALKDVSNQQINNLNANSYSVTDLASSKLPFDKGLSLNDYIS